ncbi:MAG TPA: hypothetical protein VEC06_11570 [Paucimonas sp.]|nr:hypothetical protein [Paucimonas sp.]
MEQRGRKQQRRRGRRDTAWLLAAIAVTLLSCERSPPLPNSPPDSPPKPQTGAAQASPALKKALYSYTGRPASLYLPDVPIPVRRAATHT